MLTLDVPEEHNSLVPYPYVLGQRPPLHHIEGVQLLQVVQGRHLVHRLLLLSHRLQDTLQLLRDYCFLDLQLYYTCMVILTKFLQGRDTV
jgi:hypothetical protein